MAPIQTGYTDTPDGALYYERAGTGPALVLLHADVADRRMWDDVWLTLAERYTVVRYDRPGFGDSAPVDSVESHHAQLAALLDGLGIEQAHVLGCSRGGEIALSFALAFPARARSVIAVSATPSGFEMQGPPPDGIMQMMNAYQNGDIPATVEWMNRIYLAGNGRSLDQIDAALRERVTAMNTVALTQNAWQIAERAPLTPPAVERLDDLTAPLLAVVGTYDHSELARAAQVMADGVANGSVWTVDHAAHLLPMEIPDAFSARVRAFLDMTP